MLFCWSAAQRKCQLLQTWVRQTFEPKNSVSARLSADLSGALNSVKASNFKIFSTTDGIRYWNHRQNHHSWHSLIKADGQPPMGRPVEIVLRFGGKSTQY